MLKGDKEVDYTVCRVSRDSSIDVRPSQLQTSRNLSQTAFFPGFANPFYPVAACFLAHSGRQTWPDEQSAGTRDLHQHGSRQPKFQLTRSGCRAQPQLLNT
ncbi:hypothetical protein VTI28DRAFT_5051 [Corynascus sepedonium]